MLIHVLFYVFFIISNNLVDIRKHFYPLDMIHARGHTHGLPVDEIYNKLQNKINEKE